MQSSLHENRNKTLSRGTEVKVCVQTEFISRAPYHMHVRELCLTNKHTKFAADLTAYINEYRRLVELSQK